MTTYYYCYNYVLCNEYASFITSLFPFITSFLQRGLFSLNITNFSSLNKLMDRCSERSLASLVSCVPGVGAHCLRISCLRQAAGNGLCLMCTAWMLVLPACPNDRRCHHPCSPSQNTNIFLQAEKMIEFFPHNSRALLPTFRINCPDGVSFSPMRSHFAQNTIPNPCSLLGSHTPLSGICMYT